MMNNLTMTEQKMADLWSHCHWLTVLAEQGSYTAAAARLGVSKAAMSQRIAELERVAGALHLFAVIGAVLHLIVAERPGHAHIGFIAKHVLRPGQFRLDRWHHQLGSARPQADNGQTAAAAAQLIKPCSPSPPAA